MNRHQNHLEILLADASTGNTKTIYEERNRYFIEIDDNFVFTRDGKYFLISNETSGFRHLYLYDINGNLLNPITSGEWDMHKFLGYDQINNWVYYTSHETGPLGNHLYRIRADGTGKTRLTTDICWHKPEFSNYTERFMRTPQENPRGYDDNSPINHVDKIRGAYLLVHGSADDNVHYQNSMEMVHALIEADVDFELMIYPDHNHSIFGGNARLHLYRLMTDFLQRNLR